MALKFLSPVLGACSGEGPERASLARADRAPELPGQPGRARAGLDGREVADRSRALHRGGMTALRETLTNEQVISALRKKGPTLAAAETVS